MAWDIRAIRRFFWNIIVRDQEHIGVQKFGSGLTLTQRINDIIFKEIKRDITDPENGHDIIIVNSKQNDFPDYSRTYPIHKPSPLGNIEWLDELHDLDADFIPRSYDELNEIVISKF